MWQHDHARTNPGGNGSLSEKEQGIRFPCLCCNAIGWDGGSADVGLDYLEVIASSVSVVELCYCACVMRTVTRYTERPLRDLPATSQLRLTTVKVAL